MSLKTDNDFAADKIALRHEAVSFCENSPVRVLDCFAGTGFLWKHVRAGSKKPIQVVSIDKDPERDDVTMLADSNKILSTSDLSDYDIIDLDAYGVPYDHLKTLHEKDYRGVVVVTFIQCVMGMLPKALCLDLGMTQNMYNTVPILCSKRGWAKIRRWLYDHGWGRVIHRTKARKHYFIACRAWDNI